MQAPLRAIRLILIQKQAQPALRRARDQDQDQGLHQRSKTKGAVFRSALRCAALADWLRNVWRGSARTRSLPRVVAIKVDTSIALFSL